MKKILILSMLLSTSLLKAEQYIIKTSNNTKQTGIVVKSTLENNNEIIEPVIPTESTTEIDSSFSIKSCSHWHCYGYIDFNNQRLMEYTGNGWYMVVINPEDDSIVLNKVYGAYYNETKSQELLSDVTALPDGYFVMLGTQDEPQRNSTDIQTAITTQLNGTKVSGITYRGSYIYAGYKGGSVLAEYIEDSYDNVKVKGISYESATGEITQDINPIYASCKEILEAGKSTGNGVYTINNGSKDYNVYCDMNTDGGGWTLVVAAFEDYILYNWNEGIQSDYQPDLTTRKSFALNSSELPTHSQMSYSAVNSSDLKIGSEAFNFIYSTGNIQTQTIQSYTTLKNFDIHREVGNHYAHHDPDDNYRANTSPEPWDNTLTIDESGIRGSNFAYSPNAPLPENVGYSYDGVKSTTNELFAWAIWIR